MANYVETEQILLYHHYALSFVLTRGSIPVFWSQPGYKYRPPPVLEAESPEQDSEAFARHFDNEFSVYDKVHCVSLVEQQGRERPLAEAFFEQAIKLDEPRLAFTAFDFHEKCRAMRFENVSLLVEGIEEHLKATKYAWLDSQGLVCKQDGVFRVNCVDCLDRTNVAQTALAGAVLRRQLAKLGVFGPEDVEDLPKETSLGFRALWANNGDALSRQYAGTKALKGDYTRTGERNLSGMMKDGVNSASRYYLNQFKDAFRQAAIDVVVGCEISSDEVIAMIDEAEADSKDAETESESEDVDSQVAERVRELIEDCKKLLISDESVIVGAWGLIDNDPVTGKTNTGVAIICNCIIEPY